MKNLVDRLFTLGIGIAALSKEQAEKIAEELTQKGKMASDEASAFIDELMKKGTESREQWEAVIKEKIEQVLRESNIVTKQEFEALEKRVNELERKLNETSDN